MSDATINLETWCPIFIDPPDKDLIVAILPMPNHTKVVTRKGTPTSLPSEDRNECATKPQECGCEWEHQAPGCKVGPLPQSCQALGLPVRPGEAQ